MNHFDQRLTLDGCGGRQNGTMNVYRCLACILCNDCTIVALKSGRLAVVRMTFTGRINGVQLRRDWLAWLGLIAIGMVIGVFFGVVIVLKHH
jgi:hypothetical protein